jgi:rhodanese-related sulfurtransferase
MKKLSILLSALCISPCFAENQDTKKAVQYFHEELEFNTNPNGVKKVVDGIEKNVTIVDVRDEKSYKEGHIPGAINIPYEKHNGFNGDEKEFPQLRKDGYNYVYCYTGNCNLAQKACKKFASLGYQVKEVAGGYTGWTEDKTNPVEK